MTLPPWVETEWDRLTLLTGLYVATGYVAGEHAQSLLWIGPPGSGKSTMVRRFSHVPTVRELADVTADPLRRIVIPEVATRGLRHLIFPEFHKPFQRKADTVQNMVGVLTAGMSGELRNSLIGPDQASHTDFPDVQFGIIGAITPDIFSQWRRSFLSTGVHDRLTAMEFHLPPNERATVERSILAGVRTAATEPTFWSWPTMPVAIGYNPSPSFLRSLTRWLDEVRGKGSNRNRLASQVRVMLKAIALMRRQTTVTDADLAVLDELQPYFKGAAS